MKPVRPMVTALSCLLLTLRIAPVRGTVWLVEDRCEGTNTKVRRGVVAVRDFKRKKTVSVKAGHSYLARAVGRRR